MKKHGPFFVPSLKQCGAYASSRKNSGIGYGNSKSIAESKALDECGTKACKIVVSDCE